MAQLVSTFCSKSKCKQPSVEFAQEQGSTPACTCTVTLYAHEVDGYGIPETAFARTERNKKAAKAAAMKAAHEFLSQTEAYKKFMSAPEVRDDRPNPLQLREVALTPAQLAVQARMLASHFVKVSTLL